MAPFTKRSRTSECWEYTANLNADGNLPRNASNREIWRCLPCVECNCSLKEYDRQGGTHNFQKHLKEKHGIKLLTSVEAKQQQDAQGHRKISEMGSINAAWCIKGRVAERHVALQAVEAGVLQLFFAEMLAGDNLPATLVKSLRFR